MSTTGVRLITGLSMLALLALAQTVPVEIGKGWLPEFNHASNQMNALAEATPADKFGWRPAPGVRSVGEVYMHVTLGNYFLLGQAGVKLPASATAVMKGGEKGLTEKAEIVKALQDSQVLVRESYPKAEHARAVKFFGGDTTVDGVLLRLLVHNHEHMGQSIGYARMVGVVPPWSQSSPQ